MIRFDELAAGWRPVMEHDGATFSQHTTYPDVWRRQRPIDGRVEVRYAWDGDGVVTPLLSDIADKLNGPRWEAGSDDRDD